MLADIETWLTPTWLDPIAAYTGWVTEHGRLPGWDGGNRETLLAAWALGEARTAAASPARRHELDLRVPYLLDPLQAPWIVARSDTALEHAHHQDVARLEARWHTRLDAYVAWVKANGRAPAQASTNVNEARLARWFHGQSPKTLTAYRAAELDRLFPRRDGQPRAHFKDL